MTKKNGKAKKPLAPIGERKGISSSEAAAMLATTDRHVRRLGAEGTLRWWQGREGRRYLLEDVEDYRNVQAQAAQDQVERLGGGDDDDDAPIYDLPAPDNPMQVLAGMLQDQRQHNLELMKLVIQPAQQNLDAMQGILKIFSDRLQGLEGQRDRLNELEKDERETQLAAELAREREQHRSEAWQMLGNFIALGLQAYGIGQKKEGNGVTETKLTDEARAALGQLMKSLKPELASLLGDEQRAALAKIATEPDSAPAVLAHLAESAPELLKHLDSGQRALFDVVRHNGAPPQEAN